MQAAVKKSRKRVPSEADELLREYGDLRAEGLYGQLASASSRRFWWHTGEAEVALGLWIAAVGVIFAAYPVDGISSVAGWVLLLVSLSIPIVVPMLLRDVLEVLVDAPERYSEADRARVLADAGLISPAIVTKKTTRKTASAKWATVLAGAAIAAAAAGIGIALRGGKKEE